MQVVLEQPLSITEISERLGRDPSTVKREVDLLVASALVGLCGGTGTFTRPRFSNEGLSAGLKSRPTI